MKSDQMNDQERAQWVTNDEPLYNEWRRSRKSLGVYIRENREALDAVIRSRLAPAWQSQRFVR